MTPLRPRATEIEYTATLVHACRVAGYVVHHSRPAMTKHGYRTALMGHAGLPDLLIVGHGRIMFVELKKSGNKLTREQIVWFNALSEAGADVRLLVVPDGMDEFIAELAERRAA